MAKLTARSVETTKRRGRYGDGLYLLVSGTGAKSWVFRYMRNGVSHDMGLGPVEALSLADARAEAFAAKQLLRNGGDPLSEQQAQRATRKSTAPTLKEFADDWIKRQEPSWRNEKHRAQWRNTLRT